MKTQTKCRAVIWISIKEKYSRHEIGYKIRKIKVNFISIAGHSPQQWRLMVEEMKGPINGEVEIMMCRNSKTDF